MIKLGIIIGNNYVFTLNVCQFLVRQLSFN